MTIEVVEPGLQTTVQGRPRLGHRHIGVPTSGAADPLSMALANRLVGNELLAPALETTLNGVSLRFQRHVQIAVTGAIAQCHVNGDAVMQHRSLNLNSGDTLCVGSAEAGARSYIAFAGGLCADDFLGSFSTYLPANLGGYRGRALRKDDTLELDQNAAQTEILDTPQQFRSRMFNSWTLRTGRSVETELLADTAQLFDTRFEIGNQNDRMGIKLEGGILDIRSDGRMPSAPVFPGVVQCPAGGEPILMSVDAQTTGGYPRVAKVIRADLHLIGQLRAGDRLAFIERTDDHAAEELRDKHEYWREWLPDIANVI